MQSATSRPVKREFLPNVFRQRLSRQFVSAFIPVTSISGEYVFATRVSVLNQLGYIAPIGDGMASGYVAKCLAVWFGFRAIECHDGS